MMNYTAKQIETAKRKYNNFLQHRTAADENPEIVGRNTAEQRSEYHNNMVNEIRNGNKELEREWKLFFLNEEVKQDAKDAASKAKKAANKEASADILQPIKDLRKLGEFGKWLNTSGNQYRKQHFNKKYTVDAVNEFLSTL